MGMAGWHGMGVRRGSVLHPGQGGLRETGVHTTQEGARTRSVPVGAAGQGHRGMIPSRLNHENSVLLVQEVLSSSPAVRIDGRASATALSSCAGTPQRDEKRPRDIRAGQGRTSPAFPTRCGRPSRQATQLSSQASTKSAGCLPYTAAQCCRADQGGCMR